jgi:hypothetical protein
LDIDNQEVRNLQGMIEKIRHDIRIKAALYGLKKRVE